MGRAHGAGRPVRVMRVAASIARGSGQRTSLIGAMKLTRQGPYGIGACVRIAPRVDRQNASYPAMKPRYTVRSSLSAFGSSKAIDCHVPMAS